MNKARERVNDPFFMEKRNFLLPIRYNV